jgi:hypothetical protein
MSDAKTPPEPSIDEILATIRRIISDDEQGGAAAANSPGGTAGEPSPKAAPTKAVDADDVLELTEALNEDGTTRHLAPIGGATTPRPGPSGETPRAEPQLRLRPLSPPEPELPRGGGPNLRLAPAQPSAGQPSAGQGEPRLPRDTPVGNSERTLEDIVRDTLRPLLQAWLDENLPPVVERLVQAEITRVAREAAGRS